MRYKIEKVSEAFPRIQARMEKAWKKIDLPDREIYILRQIVYNTKNAQDVCRAIWGISLDWEEVKEYISLYYLWDELYAYRNNDEVYFVQAVETIEDTEIDGWHEERLFYIFEKSEVPEWGEYKIVKISATYGNIYSRLVSDEEECKKILSVFPEFSRAK